MKNFYRLNNDIILNLNNKRERIGLDFVSKSSEPSGEFNQTQFILNNVTNIKDFNDETFGENAETNCINLDVMFRQSYITPPNYNAFQITLMYMKNGFKMLVKFIVMYRDVKPINPITIDGSVFYGSVNVDIPEQFFVSDSFTIYKVEPYLFDNSQQTKFDDYIGQNPLNLVGFEPLSKLNLEIGNIENYIKLVGDYLEIGLINLDENKTIEQSIFDQLNIGEQYIQVLHNIEYGFSDSLDTDFSDVTIFKSVGLMNNSNSVVPVEYKPIFDNIYDVNTINKVLHIMVETIITVGSTKFTRYTDNKFDFNSFFIVNDRVTVSPVQLTHNIENIVTNIESKTVIKPVVVNQLLGYNLATNIGQFEYVENMAFMFNDFSNIIEPNYIMNVNGLFDMFGRLDANNQLFFLPNSQQKGQIMGEFKNKKVISYTVRTNDNENTIVRNGEITLKK